MDDYSEHPQSVAEIRAGKAGRERLLTPRDALIDMLRYIDSGKVAPQTLVICWSEPDQSGEMCAYFSAAGPDILTSLGTVEAAKTVMLLGGR